MLSGQLFGVFFTLSDGDFIYRRTKAHASGTAYGDGTYYDNKGNEYGVDAGLLGIIPLKAIKNPDLNEMKKLGAVMEFDKNFEVHSADGIFSFGFLTINTRDEEDE